MKESFLYSVGGGMARISSETTQTSLYMVLQYFGHSGSSPYSCHDVLHSVIKLEQ